MASTENFFESIYNNTKQNAIMIMSDKGIVQQVNEAFTTAYGYTNEDLRSKHFRLLYIEKDQVLQRPEIELNITHRQGSHGDENYLVHKDGTPIWVTGESVLIKADNSTCIVKIIHNIHAQKQLERYLLASSELLDSLFDSVHSGLLLLDSTLRVVKTNSSFHKLFGLQTSLTEGSKLQDIPHQFWHNEELRNDVRNVLVTGEKINKEYIWGNDKNDFRRVHIVSKLMLGEGTEEKRILLVVKDG